MLLNTSLTVRQASAGSHAGRGWEQFTDAVVDAIDLYGGLELESEKASSDVPDPDTSEAEPSSKRQKTDGDVLPTNSTQSGFGKGVVFLCWGKWAADRVARLSEVGVLLQFNSPHQFDSIGRMFVSDISQTSDKTSHFALSPPFATLSSSRFPRKRTLQTRQ